MRKFFTFFLVYLLVFPNPYAAASQEDSPFGVLAFLSWNHSWNAYKYDQKGLIKIVKLLKEMGCGWVRVDFSWNDLEPQKGKWQFSKYDFLVNLLSKNDISVLAILDYSANWAAPSWNSPPDNDEDFVNYVNQTVKRYGDKVKYWEVWNEPDCKFYWNPQDGMVRYSQLLTKVYQEIKKVSPTAKVVLGGLTGDGYYALKNIYRITQGKCFDVVNVHPFENPLKSGAIERIRNFYKHIRKLMVSYHDQDKKIWFTELGCPGVKAQNDKNTWWEGISPLEKEQAEFVTKVYSELLSLNGVEKIFWAYLRDNKDHFHSGIDYFGLLRWDYSKKPSFFAYKNAVKQWKNKYNK